jgi:nucleoid-associated protein YgaU
MEKLRRENEELRAQNATLRGGSSIPVSRAAPMISLPDEAQPRQPPPPVNGVTNSSPITAAPQSRNAAPAGPTFQTPPASSGATTRAAVPVAATPSSARTHRVAPKETLYGISVKYYGHGRNVDAIYQANRDQMRNREDVRPGMTLRLPNVDGAGAPRR